MHQTKTESLIEAVLNTVIGFVVSMLANFIILPAVGIPVTVGQSIKIGIGMTLVSVARSYILRRFCQKHLTGIRKKFMLWLSK